MPTQTGPVVNLKQHSKCPHVILIGDFYQEDLDEKVKQFEYTLNQRLLSLTNEASSSSNEDELDTTPNDQQLVLQPSKPNSPSLLKCNECDCYKNLWLCLRENCMYVGCGQDQNSRKHSSLHANKFYHPLSINLTNRSVWCELCSSRVYLDSNNPFFNFKKRKLSKNKNTSSSCVNARSFASTNADDFDLVSYLDQDNCESEENRSDRRGQIGLDNLGNTCYMNAAFQALSNCYAFTSYFLDCSPQIHYQSQINQMQSSNRTVSILFNYAKLMRDLWQRPTRVNLKTNRVEEISSLVPKDLVNTIKFKNSMFHGYQQQDSQEFLIYLMDQLHEELKRPVLIDNDAVEEEETDEDEDDDTTVVQTKATHSDIDSGVSTLTNGSQSKQSSERDEDDDDTSIDSFETCGDVNSSDLSDKLDYSDADECFSCSNENKEMNNKCDNIQKNKQNKTQVIPAFTSIVSETFEGKLISHVQCLECNNISTTTESFQHLSLPIPSKEYLNAMHSRVLSKQNSATSLTNSDPNQQYQSWLGWIVDVMKGYVWSSTIKLSDCLTAFFSEDDLRGDNMYSCEKCKKHTNGVKYSKIQTLPEVLIIHLKRFRHDSMFSTGKINSFISFPLDNLNMQPFVHRECKNEITQYDLNSIICHYGSSNGGHYTSLGRNHFNEEWYEYDDSYCREIDSLTVQNSQAYVLFYKKKNIKTDSVKEHLRSQFVPSKISMTNESLLRPYFISKQWLHKLKYFGEPGSIDNSDFLCKHNFVYPNLWKIVDNVTLQCCDETWNYLVENFGLKFKSKSFKNFTNYLQPCKECQLEDEKIKQRQEYEISEFIKLRDKSTIVELNSNQNKQYAISANWFKEWQKFVQMPGCPLRHQISGKINNIPICLPVKNKDPQKVKYQLNIKSNNFKISEEMWRFLLEIYGGGPELLVNGAGGSNIHRSKSEIIKVSRKRNDTSESSVEQNGIKEASANYSKINKSFSDDSNLKANELNESSCTSSNLFKINETRL